MNLLNVSYIIAVIGAIWGVISAMVMTAYVSKHGEKINFFFIRFMIIKYISRYHELTKQANGKPGFWFYSYLISMNLALLVAVAGILFGQWL